MTTILEAQSVSLAIGRATLVDGIDLRVKAGDMTLAGSTAIAGLGE